MTFMKTFDFSDLSTIEINAEMEGFQPRFDNTLALTAYQQQTLILTREGQVIILNCRLQECLNRFRRENGICRHELNAYYSMAHCQTQAIISGHYRLVPTHGASNHQVVYYMAHHLDTYSYSRKLNRLLIILKGRVNLYQLRVDASFSSFGRILTAADQVANLQLANIEDAMWRMGTYREHNDLRPASGTYLSHQQGLALHQRILANYAVAVTNEAFLAAFGELPDADFRRRLSSVIGYPGMPAKKDEKVIKQCSTD